MPSPLLIAHGSKDLFLLPQMANRHGLIAGATGTGKTVSLQVMAEALSGAGVPVFMADVKGDLAGLSQPGTATPKVRERIEKLALGNFAFAASPVTFWDVFGGDGHPVRATVSEMGPLLLGRILDLNQVQQGVLSIVFKVADDNGLLLLDLKDLRAMVQYVGENAKQFTSQYGNVSSMSIGAIQRGLLELEQQQAAKFFGEPALNYDDWLQTAGAKGRVNILAADKLKQAPRLYATFLLWMLSELYERLPEVGDAEKPRLVFFFDEAHLLFDDAPAALLEKIEQIVRLVRSKGVGVYFVTQNPLDVPDVILGRPAGVHSTRSEGCAGGGGHVPFQSQPRRRQSDHRAGSRRGSGLVSRGKRNPGSGRTGVHHSAPLADRRNHREAAPGHHQFFTHRGAIRENDRSGVGV